MKSLSVLLLAADPQANATTITDHLAAINQYSRHRVYVNARTLLFSGELSVMLELERFDAIILHYSLYLLNDAYLNGASRERIAGFSGVKILFVQDEYRQVDRMKSVIRSLGIDVLFTCVPASEMEKVYPSSEFPGLTRISTLTGFVPEQLTRRGTQPLKKRRIDVGYRGRKLPYWLGALGAEKWQIVPGFLGAVKGFGLVCSLSYEEQDRIYGKAWIEFIASCKAVLGVESGASVFDFSGKIQRDVETYMASHPEATFEEVQARFLAQDEGRISLNQISPRCFEAAALRTAMILFEGKYSGILQPWRHYVPLKKDFSNIAEVGASLRNVDGLQRIADCAYQEIALSPRYSYRRFVHDVDEAIDRAYLAKTTCNEGGANQVVCVHASRQRHAYTRLGFLVASRHPIGASLLGALCPYWLAVPERTRTRCRRYMRPVRRFLERL